MKKQLSLLMNPLRIICNFSKIIGIIALVLFSSVSSFAQDQIKVYGLILDKDTKEPIPYAHIGLPDQGIGTTSGGNGYFELKIPEAYKKSIMIVSFMGYKTYKKVVENIKSPSDILLEKATLELGEIIVADEAAVENIIRKAVKRIPKNYPTHPTTVLGFYREAKTDDSLQYLYLAEGVLNIYKQSYKKDKEGYVSLVQGRRINLKNPLDTIVRGGLTSGHMAAHRFDFVQNREDFIDEKYFPVYKYWIENITSYNDRPVYIIGFGKDPEGGTIETSESGTGTGTDIGGLLGLFLKKKRVVKEGARMEGRIYIDKESYAFIRAEFEILPEGLKKINDYPLYAGSWDKNNYVVNYRQLGDTWYFSDATREGILTGGNRYSNEVKITDINSEKSAPLPYLDRIGRGAAFSRITGKYDPEFWADYNTTPLSEDLAKSVQQLENAVKAQEAFDAENMLRLERQRDSIYVAQIEAREMAKRIESGESVESVEDFKLDSDQVQEILKTRNNERRKRRGYDRVKFHLGLGTHLIQSGVDQLGIAIITEEEPPETIISLNEDLENRDFEITGNWDLDIFFRKNFFVRFGSSFDFYNSIYKERSIGFGTELNLSKQRPFYLKAIAQYSSLKYARKLGEVDNEYGNFKFDDKKFNSKLINMYYGNRTHNLKLSAEISLEMNPNKEYYIRGTYFLPFSKRQEVWLKERRQFFNKKRAASIDEPYIVVDQADTPYDVNIIDEPTFSFTFGMLFK
jgi:carboxypeptidase-like protein